MSSQGSQIGVGPASPRDRLIARGPEARDLRTRLAEALTRRPQRSWTLPVLGMIVGLAVAGVGVFRKAPAPADFVPPGYVALVNGQGILMSDFIHNAQVDNNETRFPLLTAAQRRAELHKMINHELLVQRALVLNLPETTTNVRSILEQAVNAQVMAPVMELNPTDQQLLAYFDRHRSRYVEEGSMKLRDLVLHYGGLEDADQSQAQALEDAAQAVYQLRSGRPLAQVMERYGLVDSGRVNSNSTQLDFGAKLHLGDKLYAAAEKLYTGEVSDPVVDVDGVHILIMEKRVPPTPATFDQVRLEVYNGWVSDQQQRAVQENLKFLRSQARILLAPGQAE